MEPITILIADSEEVFREGITRLLKELTGMEIVYHGGSGKHAIEQCLQSKPDMVLVDTHIADTDALQAVREIKIGSPGTKIVMLSRPDSGKNPIEFLKAGARAFLSKDISAKDLIKSLELISSGRIIVSHLFADKFLEELSASKSGSPVRFPQADSLLSEREMEIARLIAEGATNKEIAEKLCITENTAKVHVKNILNKLELKNRQQLAVYAVVKEWVARNPDFEKKDSSAS